MTTLDQASMVLEHEQIAAEINAEHERAYGKAREALEHARRAGELLLQAKASIGHGGWIGWVKANCKFSIRTAQGYMRLAEHWPEIEAKCATVAHLNLRSALHLLSAPATEPPPSCLLGLDAQTELSTNFAGGRLVVISPSTHEGFYFIDCVDTRSWIAEGWARPIRGDCVSAALSLLGVPPETLWVRHPVAEPRGAARWMKTESERVANCVALGLMC